MLDVALPPPHRNKMGSVVFEILSLCSTAKSVDLCFTSSSSFFVFVVVVSFSQIHLLQVSLLNNCATYSVKYRPRTR